MKLSIIIPVYNVEKYIKECLESVYDKNNITDFEVLCVDDCGNDDSVLIIKDFVKNNNIKNLKIIKHKKNSGLSASRNTGLRNAKGKYVFFLDSDDMINSREIEMITESAMKKKLDIAEGTFIEIFETSEEKLTHSHLKTISDGIVFSGEKYFEIISRNFMPMVWQRIYKRRFLIENNLWFREGLKFEDEEFSPRAIIKAKRIAHFDYNIYIYRRRDNSITTSMNKDNSWIGHYIVIIESLNNFYSQNINIIEKECSEALYNRISQIVLSLYKNTALYKSDYKEIVEIVKEKKLYMIPRKSTNLFIKIQGFFMKYHKLFFLLYKLVR